MSTITNFFRPGDQLVPPGTQTETKNNQLIAPPDSEIAKEPALSRDFLSRRGGAGKPGFPATGEVSTTPKDLSNFPTENVLTENNKSSETVTENRQNLGFDAEEDVSPSILNTFSNLLIPTADDIVSEEFSSVSAAASIYFQEFVNDRRISFWCIKSDKNYVEIL
jgi:hypothetical protein